MIGTLLAIGALAIALVIGLGRQITVFTAWERGLWLFRRYDQKRLIGLCASGVLIGGAMILEPQPVVGALAVATGVFAALALLFRLEWLFPALEKVRAVPAQAARLDNDAPVMVVGVPSPTDPLQTHSARAYPLDSMVIPRHIVHDLLDATPVLVTYCALCRSGLAFRSMVGDQPARFRVVGVFRRNLIMEDTVTWSLWQQATGAAIYGPLAGTTLSLLPATQMRWSKARATAGPALTVATDPPGVPRPLFASRRGLLLLKYVTERVMVPGHTEISSQLPPRETVFGIVVRGVARAYPESQCKVAGEFADTVGEVTLRFAYDRARGTLAVSRADGEPPPVVERHWWLGWNEFHPDSTVWRAP